MSTDSIDPVARARDPVCGMSVRLDVALEDRLVTEYEHHTYAFCRAGCRDEFLADPGGFVTSHGHRPEAAPTGSPEIDDGMRRWYESCSCCLSDAYPDVKAALDQERAANAQPQADPGICEVAESAQAEAAKG